MWHRKIKMHFSDIDETMEAYIRLRKSKEDGNEPVFEPGWANELLDAVNDLLWRRSPIRFGNAEYHDWKYISMEALLPGTGPSRSYARLEAHFDGASPEYVLALFNSKGSEYAEYRFFHISDQETGLLQALKSGLETKLERCARCENPIYGRLFFTEKGMYCEYCFNKGA